LPFALKALHRGQECLRCPLSLSKLSRFNCFNLDDGDGNDDGDGDDEDDDDEEAADLS